MESVGLQEEVLDRTNWKHDIPAKPGDGKSVRRKRIREETMLAFHHKSYIAVILSTSSVSHRRLCNCSMLTLWYCGATNGSTFIEVPY